MGSEPSRGSRNRAVTARVSPTPNTTPRTSSRGTAPSPVSEPEARARKTRTKGRASPSLTPDSMLSSRRSRRGTSLRPTMAEARSGQGPRVVPRTRQDGTGHGHPYPFRVLRHKASTRRPAREARPVPLGRETSATVGTGKSSRVSLGRQPSPPPVGVRSGRNVRQALPARPDGRHPPRSGRSAGQPMLVRQRPGLVVHASPASTSRRLHAVGTRRTTRRASVGTRCRRVVSSPARTAARGRTVQQPSAAPVPTAAEPPRPRFRPVGMAGRPGRAGGVVQWRATSWRCQRSMVAGVTRSPRRRRTGSCRVRAPSRARSVQLIRGRGMRRWSTASWWRRTSVSISLGRRIAPGARSSSGARRTFGRPAAAPSADHAWPPAANERASLRAVRAVSGTHRRGGPRVSWSPSRLLTTVATASELPRGQ